MVAKGYCQPSDIGNLLGVILTPEQTAEAAILIAAAEGYVDGATNRGWLIPPVTGERHNLLAPTIYLTYRPVASVGTIRTRTPTVGEQPLTLTAGVDYELFDLTLGQINLVTGYRGPHAVAFVDYVPDLGTVPPEISHATALIASSSMYASLNAGAYGIKSAMVERGVQIVYQDGASTLMIPEAAQVILDMWSYPIIG